MRNIILLVSIVAMLIIAGIVLSRNKIANAPTVENKTEPKNNQINENKPMQLEIKTTQEGTGERQVKKGDTISVHYTGRLIDGTKFDSSVDRGTPFTFTIGTGQVIQGWEQGFIGAKVGEKRTLTIPAEMGYGSRVVGTIPANSTLIFDVELVAIK